MAIGENTNLKPDLVVHIPHPPVLPVPSNVRFNVIVENQGNADAGKFSVDIKTNAGYSDKVEIDGLEIGQEKVLKCGPIWYDPRYGIYKIKATVDPDNKVDESNESNNVSKISF